MTPYDPILSVVLPARNEAALIQDTVRTVAACLEGLEPRYEIVVGDSGSADGTGERVQALGLDRVRVVREELPGKGRVLSSALRNARGRYVGFLDADLEIPVDTLEGLFDAIRAGADVAIAAKTPDTDRHRPLPRRILSRTYNLSVRMLLGSRLPDHQAGCKLFRAEVLGPVLAKPLSTGWLWDTEVLIRLARRGARIDVLPCEPGPARPTRVRPGSLFTAARDFVGLWLRLQTSRREEATGGVLAPLDTPSLRG